MLLEVNELYRFYHVGNDEIVALRGVSFNIELGELVALMGPSGSGKSTLLACITGLDEPDGGQVEIGGERMTRKSEKVRARIRALHLGVMMQSGNLFQHLTVNENIRLRMLIAGIDDHDRLAAVLSAVGMAHRGQSYPSQLSGGETARAGLATALAINPPLLVADEPTAEVDRETEEKVVAHFEARRAAGMATLLSTHSTTLAARADRVIRLKDGRVEND